MTTTRTKTVRDIVQAALRKASILDLADQADGETAAAAMEELDVMLKAWQGMGYNLWTKTSGQIPLMAQAEHTLTPVRPLSILDMRLVVQGTERDMIALSRDAYDALPYKSARGLPTQYHYDRQREDARVYVWPVPTAVSGETILYTYERELEDIRSLNDTIDVPSEWWDAVILNLAARMAETVPLGQPQTLFMRADAALAQAAAFDREDSVFFAGEWADW